MARTTIDFGIDLGTTNSAVAVRNGDTIEVIRNNESAEITPSAVGVDRRGRLIVGRVASEYSEQDAANTSKEFKRMMGMTGDPTAFKAAGMSMGPEQLSAEVLKSLKRDVEQRTGEDITSAVITVPAAFELGACEATKRAAELAGLTYSPLLQEPIAAAYSYGLASDSDNAYWLVYDLGGGTFDAAVLRVRDGEFSVINHCGDNYLGGKLIDWEIIDEFIVPAVIRQLQLTDFGRGNAKWARAFAKLKGEAERAKIYLSRADSFDRLVEFKDDRGEFLDFEFELRRQDVERVAESLLTRSINLCKKALEEKHLAPGDVEKVLLVGGPTLAPYVRERLADAGTGLGIPLDYSQDPLTVVARGAAIFASTQRVKDFAPPPPAPGEFRIELDYRPAGPDIEPFVGGRVLTDGTGLAPDGLAGFAVEFVNEKARPAWRSGKVPLQPTGGFATTLMAERGVNTFQVELTDATGSRRKVTPSTLTYSVVSMIGTKPLLTHSVGVGLENNEVAWLVEKGTELPAKRRQEFRTAVAIDRGLGKGMLRIPVLEGEHSRADRNHQIGRLEVEPDQVRRDVPEGSEVQVTLEIDESRLVLCRAYVPILDEEFEHPLNLQTVTVPDHDRLALEAERERHRLDEVRRKAAEVAEPGADAVLRRIDAEHMMSDIETMVEAARVDPDAAASCGRRLLDLRAAIDEAEEALAWPLLLTQAEEMLSVARELVLAKGDASHRRGLAGLEATVRTAIDAHDAELLRQRLDELRGLVVRVLDHVDVLPDMVFDDLRSRQAQMDDPAEAGRLFAEGDAARRGGDSRALRAVNEKLAKMLPTAPDDFDPFTTIRKN